MEGAVHTEYAEVLRVEPIYLPPSDESAQCPPLDVEPLLSSPTQTQSTPAATHCTPPEPGQQTEAKPQILYDVDYVLHGVKYRSRLPYDPGNQLQVQLSVTPLISSQEQPPPDGK